MLVSEWKIHQVGLGPLKMLSTARSRSVSHRPHSPPGTLAPHYNAHGGVSGAWHRSEHRNARVRHHTAGFKPGASGKWHLLCGPKCFMPGYALDTLLETGTLVLYYHLHILLSISDTREWGSWAGKCNPEIKHSFAWPYSLWSRESVKISILPHLQQGSVGSSMSSRASQGD